jgi:hypothetical protein
MRFTFVFIFLLSVLSVKGQPTYTDPVYYTNHIFNGNIKSVQLYQERWNLSYPILKLHSNDNLVFHFATRTGTDLTYSQMIILTGMRKTR